MYLTDEQIMLLEQLTYLTDEVALEAGVTLGPYGSVESLLSQFDEDALKKLEDSDEIIDWVSTKKWAAIIRRIKSDKELYSLDIADKNDSVPAVCFQNPAEPDSAIVAFRGTAGQDEWVDNALGLGTSDTERQKAALEYIENLPFESITVAGHSKGGNKAQYVTILSDKVNRCISMDGQGFSQEFIDKYYAEIQRKGACIKNYYLEGDFVSILMFPVPGAIQICIKGDDSVTGAEIHCASSFFHFLYDKDKGWTIECGADGTIRLFPGKRESSMIYLHEFTTFIINVMPEDERTEAGEYIGRLLALAMVENSHFELDGEVYTPENILEYILSDTQMLSKVLAYFIRYVETYNLTEDEIRSLAEVFGMTELLEDTEEWLEDHNKTISQVISDAGGILNLIVNEIRDGKEDPLIGILLQLLSRLLRENMNIDADLADIWRRTEAEYHKIRIFDADTARKDASCKAETVRDFSERTYGILMSAIAAVEADTYGSVAGWSQYAGEDWYETLFISNAIGGINTYFEKVSEIGRTCRFSVQHIYEQADQADRKNGERLGTLTGELKSLRERIEEKAFGLQG